MVTVRTLVLVTLLLLSAVASGSAVGTDDAGAVQSSIAGTQVDADDVLLAADVQADGSAAWRIEYRVRLDDENSTEAFESLRQDIEADPGNYTQTFRDRMVPTADAAEASTGREMAIENVTVSAERKQLPREYGVVTYRFTWTGFAAVEDSRLRAGDALAGMFLDSGTTLLLTWSEEYEAQSIDPSPDDRNENSASWSGPREFAADQPSLVLAARSTGGAPISLLPLALLGAFIVGSVLGAAWYRRGGSLRSSLELGGGAETSNGGAEGGAGGRTTAGSAGGSTEAAGAEAASAETTGGAEAQSATEAGEQAGAAGAVAAGSDERDVPDELLSNEERVLKLLKDHGGRMKQQQVVAELDWTEAKTSQVVSDLREEEEIKTFRIGRENVLTLPGEDEL